MSGRGSADSARRARGGGGAPCPTDLRAVALVGPSGSGKTTLLEHLLVTAGAIGRAGSVPDGTCVGDHDPAARQIGRSVCLCAASLTHRGVKVDLVDTPGCTDFVGDVRAGMRAADSVLFCLDAVTVTDAAGTGDVLPGAASLWHEVVAAGLPATVVLTRADHERADPGAAVAALAVLLGGREEDGPVPVLAFRGDGDDALEESVEALIESCEDEELLERYLGGEELDAAALRADLVRATAARAVVPVAPVTAVTGLGMSALLDLLVDVAPAPDGRAPLAAHGPGGSMHDPLRVDREGPLVAEVVHTGADDHGSRVSLLRVFSGTLHPDATLAVVPRPRRAPDDADGSGGSAGHDPGSGETVTVRLARLHSPLGATLREVDACAAGDLCSVTRLGTVTTGDTLVATDCDAVGIDMWEAPDALLPVALTGAQGAAADALAKGLARLGALEPELRVERDPETRQVVLWCTGDVHADVLLGRLRAAGAPVEVTDVVVPRRETVAGPAAATGRHVKQSGGHGQYAVCRIEIEPLPAGGGVEFRDQIVGGVVPRAYIPAVEKGVRDQLAAGVHDGRPVVDVRVTLVDGKAHSVDSSDQAFQTAGALAIREAVPAAGTVVLEPIDDVVVTVDDDRLGSVLGDLATRNARVVGTEPGAEGHTRVLAEVPQAALVRYPVELSVLTGGTARFTRRFGHYGREAAPDRA